MYSLFPPFFYGELVPLNIAVFTMNFHQKIIIVGKMCLVCSCWIAKHIFFEGGIKVDQRVYAALDI